MMSLKSLIENEYGKLLENAKLTVSSPLTEKDRKKLGNVAMETLKEGCHFLNGAKGDRPGESDGHPFQSDTTKLKQASLNLRNPIVRAATHRNIGGLCCGRFMRAEDAAGTMIGRIIDISDPKLKTMLEFWEALKVLHGEVHEDWASVEFSSKGRALFPRICRGNNVLGEDCLGRRHFDCIGFVNFCIATALSRPKWMFGFEHYKSIHRVGALDVKGKSFKDGDILIKDIRHIGIVHLHNKHGPIVINAPSGPIGLAFNILTAKERKKWSFHIRLK